MSQAVEFIQALASNMGEVRKPLAAILETLEDGEALTALGASDEDQPMIEDAHDLVSGWIAAGHTTLDQVA